MDTSPELIKPLIQASLQYLAIRIRSREEMVTYLKKKTSDRDTVDEVMAYLDGHKLINDEEFARAWAESRLRKGKGDLIIREELWQKGVQRSIVDQALAAIDDELWTDSLEKVAVKYADKWLNLTGFKQKAKLLQIFHARGFSSRHIDAYLSHRLE